MKFLLPEFVENEELVARFLREAKSAVAIKNRHVAQVMDIGTLESGSPYMVMEFLKGRDLADVIAKEGPHRGALPRRASPAAGLRGAGGGPRQGASSTGTSSPETCS
jgi:serine/threonine protein kinase